MYANPAITTSHKSINSGAVSTSALVDSSVDRKNILLHANPSLHDDQRSEAAKSGASGDAPSPQFQPLSQPQPPPIPGSSERARNSTKNHTESLRERMLEQLVSGYPPQSNSSAPDVIAKVSRKDSWVESPPYVNLASVQPSPRSVNPASVHPSPRSVNPASVQPSPRSVNPASVHPSPRSVNPASAQPSPRSVNPTSAQLSPRSVNPASAQPSPRSVNPASAEPSSRPRSVNPVSAQPSPAKVPVPVQVQHNPVQYPAGQQSSQALVPDQNDKEGLLAPPQGCSGKIDGDAEDLGGKGTTSNPHSQIIIYDVSLPLDEIQAPREAVMSTVFARVWQDPVFLPGTTIAATGWVAYAMTKGRVRVISRSGSNRTVLRLPSAFPASVSVIDMAVYGNRLAGVTSDGGFVIWELPERIADDVPGHLLFCIMPGSLEDALQSVKWHPKQRDTLAVASGSNIFLLELGIVARTFRGSPLPLTELHRIANVFFVPSGLVAFDFDILHYALATIAKDSTLTLWSIPKNVPFWNHRVHGDDVPSSITVLGSLDTIVIGRQNGTVFQLFSAVSMDVLTMIKFANGQKEDPAMFGHINYDPTVQTLWVANSRRSSLIAFKIGFRNTSSASGKVKEAFFDQIVEFSGPKPMINFVILPTDADPTGEGARNVSVGAKDFFGELALISFSVHSRSVDQLLICKKQFESALDFTAAKYPSQSFSDSQGHQGIVATKSERHPRQNITGRNTSPSGDIEVDIPHNGICLSEGHGGKNIRAAKQNNDFDSTPRERLSLSDGVECDIAQDHIRTAEVTDKKHTEGIEQKNAGFGDSYENGNDKQTRKENVHTALINTSLGQVSTQEVEKLEESLHTRIRRLDKKLKRQFQRLENAHAQDKADDDTRRERILNFISSQLAKNTIRAVEIAIKDEVQHSALLALENIMSIEARYALNEHVDGGIEGYIKQRLPNAVEEFFLRPDVPNLSDIVSNTLMPAYPHQSSAIYLNLLYKFRDGIHSVKEAIAWQTESSRAQESLIRDLELCIQVLSDQLKSLSTNVPSIAGSSCHQQHQQQSNSPRPSGQYLLRSQLSQGHHSRHQELLKSGITAQTSYLLAPPSHLLPAPQRQASPPVGLSEEWDDIYLAVLSTQDPRQLRELLSRSNPEVVLPLNGPGPLSQVAVLTLLHRLAAMVGETLTQEENSKQPLWWLQRTASFLNTTNETLHRSCRA